MKTIEKVGLAILGMVLIISILIIVVLLLRKSENSPETITDAVKLQQLVTNPYVPEDDVKISDSISDRYTSEEIDVSDAGMSIINNFINMIIDLRYDEAYGYIDEKMRISEEEFISYWSSLINEDSIAKELNHTINDDGTLKFLVQIGACDVGDGGKVEGENALMIFYIYYKGDEMFISYEEI